MILQVPSRKHMWHQQTVTGYGSFWSPRWGWRHGISGTYSPSIPLTLTTGRCFFDVMLVGYLRLRLLWPDWPDDLSWYIMDFQSGSTIFAKDEAHHCMPISFNNYQLTSTTTNQSTKSTSYQLWHGRGMRQGVPLRSRCTSKKYNLNVQFVSNCGVSAQSLGTPF